jgi:quercetin dioxygenase-like cupin family protein
MPAAEVAPDERIRAGLWTTDRAPVSNAGTHDPVPDGVIPKIHPEGRGGNVFRIVDVPPDKDAPSHPDELRARGANVSAERSAKHPAFHQTDTLDYAICLEGEVWAVLDEGETLMKAGDVLIQRGTYHAWSNRTDKMARMAFILIDAEPLP